MSVAKIENRVVVMSNGRKYYLPMIESVSGPNHTGYEFAVKHRNIDNPFTVWGGKKSGGRKNEWYVEGFQSGGSVHCTSLVDAIKMLNGM